MSSKEGPNEPNLKKNKVAKQWVITSSFKTASGRDINRWKMARWSDAVGRSHCNPKAISLASCMVCGCFFVCLHRKNLSLGI